MQVASTEGQPAARDVMLARLAESTPTGRRIARYLLDGYPHAGLDSLDAIGLATHASGATVLRYVQSLGFRSHRDFQAALRREARGEVVPRSGPREEWSPAETLMLSISATVNGMVDGPLEEVVELLTARRRRVVCGGGAFSHVLAEFLWDHLRVLRPGVSVLPRGIGQAADLADLRASDVFVLFDYSPYARRTEAFARAVARKATVVAVTDPQLSPIVDCAGHVLVTHVRGIGAFDSFAPAIAGLELIVTTAEQRLGESVRKRVLHHQKSAATRLT